MTHVSLINLEEYSHDQIVRKPVYESKYSFSRSIHLLPGQSVPIHSHEGMEVILFPRKDSATLVWADGKEQALNAGTVYYQGLEPNFGVNNTVAEPFQMLVIVVRMIGASE